MMAKLYSKTDHFNHKECKQVIQRKNDYFFIEKKIDTENSDTSCYLYCNGTSTTKTSGNIHLALW